MTDHATGGGPAEIARAVRELGQVPFELLRNLAGPATTELGEWAGELVRTRRERWRRMMERTAEKLTARGIGVREVDPEFLLSVSEGASKTGDDTLQDMWSELLARGIASNLSQHPAFIEALRRMSGADAHTFRMVAIVSARPVGPARVVSVPPESALVGSFPILTTLNLLESFKPTGTHGTRMEMGPLTEFGRMFAGSVLEDLDRAVNAWPERIATPAEYTDGWNRIQQLLPEWVLQPSPSRVLVRVRDEDDGPPPRLPE